MNWIQETFFDKKPIIGYLGPMLRVSIIGSFKKGHERSVKAKKNIMASLIIKVCSISISLVLVPLTIHYVNPARYGIWITLSSIISWFGYFDVGFGNGLRNKFAEAVAMGKYELARIYISTTYTVLSLIIAFFLIVFLIINPFLNWAQILNAPSNMALELSRLALISVVFFCLQLVLQLINTVMTANQQPAKASFFILLGNLISLLTIFVLTKTTSGNLIYLGIALSFSPVLALTASSIWFYSHEYRKYVPSIKYVKFDYVPDLMGLGIKFFILQIATLVLYQTSNIIIAQLFGTEQVTSYNVAYKYFGIIPMIMVIIMMPLWSVFTEAWTKKDIQWIKGTMRKLKFLWLLLSIAAIFLLVFSNFIYRLWVGKEIIVPLSISLVLSVYVIISVGNGIYSMFLNGVGIIKLQLYFAIMAIVLNIPMSIFFGKTIGIYGVVLSNVILNGINLIWSVIQYNKIINLKATGLWAR